MVLRALRARRRASEQRRPQRRVVRRVVHDHLISVAGLLGRPVRERTGAEVGRVADVVIRWDGAAYPSVCGLVVRVGRRSAFIAAEAIATVEPTGVTLQHDAPSTCATSCRATARWRSPAHVIDHQLVDVDGVRVVRASDLYLANVGDVVRLVGVDVGMQTLLRRLGPRRLRTIPTPSKVIDWAAIQPLTAPGAPMRLDRRSCRPAPAAPGRGRRPARGPRARPAPRAARRARRRARRRGAGGAGRRRARAAAARDAAGARRRAAAGHGARRGGRRAARPRRRRSRGDHRRAVARAAAAELGMLAAFDEDTAGAAMTTVLVRATPDRDVADVVAELRALAADRLDIDGVLIVDDEGRLIDDVTLFELLVAGPGATLGELVADPLPVTVRRRRSARRRRPALRRQPGHVDRRRRRRRPAGRADPRRRRHRRAVGGHPSAAARPGDLVSRAQPARRAGGLARPRRRAHPGRARPGPDRGERRQRRRRHRHLRLGRRAVRLPHAVRDGPRDDRADRRPGDVGAPRRAHRRGPGVADPRAVRPALGDARRRRPARRQPRPGRLRVRRHRRGVRAARRVPLPVGAARRSWRSGRWSASARTATPSGCSSC